MSTVIVLSTGGMKSAVAAARIADQYELVLAHVNYGQASARAQARAIQALLPTYPNARYVELLLPHLIELQHMMNAPLHADRLTVPAAPEHSRRTGAIAPPVIGDDSEKRTTVAGQSPSNADPARDADTVTHAEFKPLIPASLRGLWPVLCTVGAQCALRFGATDVVVGLTGRESASHLGIPATGLAPDARRAFVHALNITLEILSPKGRSVRLEAPLIDSTYAEIIKLAERFGVPLEKTRTCEDTSPKPCGQCEPCRARREAFHEAQTSDPAALVRPEQAMPLKVQ